MKFSKKEKNIWAVAGKWKIVSCVFGECPCGGGLTKIPTTLGWALGYAETQPDSD